MNDTSDLRLLEDFAELFDTKLNDDVRREIRTILSNPLDSLHVIKDRQMILKAIMKSELGEVYEYFATDYKEVNYFLNVFDYQAFKSVDYLTYVFLSSHEQKRRLVGSYIQLSYFLTKIEKIFSDNVQIHNYPKSYQTELQFIIFYIQSFQLQKIRKQTSKGKLRYSSVAFLNNIVLEKRKNGDTEKFFKFLNRFEALISIAKSLKKLKFNFPDFSDSKFKITQMFHPLLPNPVKNDFEVDLSVVLITGANMSGKSTFLKTVGLVVYFAHLGFAIPANAATIPFYEHISIHINHSDDIKNGISHFMQEINNMKNVLLKVKEGKRCFAMFDELYKGTNYEDALHISAININGLSRFINSNFFISTHIYELKNLICYPINSYYLDSEIIDGLPHFTFKLKEGWSNIKIGKLLFEKEGIHELLKP